MIRKLLEGIRKKYTDLKLGVKLGLAFGIIIMLFIVPIIISLYHFNETVNIFKRTNEVTIPEIYLATSVKENLRHIEKNFYATNGTNNVTKKRDYNELSEKLHNEIVEDLNELKILLSTDKDKVDIVLELLEKENSIRNEVLNSKYKSDGERLIFNSYDPIIIKVYSTLDEITSGINQRVNDRAMASDTNSHASVIVTLIATISVIFISIIVTFQISKSILIPITEIESLANEMSNGNLKYKIEYKSKNEIGRLADVMRNSMATLGLYVEEIDRVMNEISKGNLDIKIKQKFVGDFERIEYSITNSANILSETFSNINKSSVELFSGANQVDESSQVLSRGVEEQASSIEELSMAMEEIFEKVKTNAKNSITASEKAISMGVEVDLSNNYMKEMVDAITEISDKSKEIGRIIKAIEDIAFQTNILALNAAVEAARAGLAGKGFAVVADEVRNLANKSAEAAENTTSLIEDTIRAVSKGTVIANKTANSLSSVVSSSRNIAHVLNEISKNSQEQEVFIEQVTIGVNEISTVVQNNSSAAEESAAASREFSSQSQILCDLVSQFKFEDKVNLSLSID
nr:methyl-accepting chemotaxis protein [Sedimentibacter sp.]